MSVNYLGGNTGGSQTSGNEVVIRDYDPEAAQKSQNDNISQTDNDNPEPEKKDEDVNPDASTPESKQEDKPEGEKKESQETKTGILSKKDIKPEDKESEDTSTPEPNQEDVKRELNAHISRELQTRSQGRLQTIEDVDALIAQNNELTQKLEEASNKPSRTPKFDSEEKQKLFALLNKSENPMQDIAEYAKYSKADPNSMNPKELLMTKFMADPQYKYMSEDDRLAEFEYQYNENYSDLDDDPGARRRFNAAMAEAKAFINDRKSHLNGLVESFIQSGEPDDEQDNANASKQPQISEEDQRRFNKYQSEADQELDDFGGLSLQVGDEPDDIVQIPHKDTDVDGFKQVKEMVRNPIAGYRDFFMDNYVDPHTNEINRQKLLQDKYIMKNWQSISREIYKAGINSGRARIVKEKNNTDGEGANALRSPKSAQMSDQDKFYDGLLNARTVTL